jgi:predicted permease
MTLTEKLLPIFLLALAGYLLGRSKSDQTGELSRALSNIAFLLFIPALLFRTTARIDVAHLDFKALSVFFVPTVLLMGALFAWNRGRRLSGDDATIRALSVTFGNTVQIGIPVVVAVFGERGLAIHAAIIAVHSLVLISIATVMMEWSRARRGEHESYWATARQVVRQTVIHPVILPVLAGYLWNLIGLPIPGPVDATLIILAQAAVPLCLVLIGLSLAHYGVEGVMKQAMQLAGIKLLIHPALVAIAAFGVASLDRTTASVTVMCAALPVGSNALLFAQRYRVAEKETTAAIVVSTVAYALTISILLAFLTR